MDHKQLTEKAGNLIKKYRYLILALLAGLLLMSVPQKTISNKNEQLTSEQPAEKKDLEEKLTQILSQIQGAGKVKVMLTVLKGEEIIYQTDEDLSNNSDTTTSKTDTITITDSNRNQDGLIRQIIPPTYRGAIIVCEGAEYPEVKLAITEAVSRITGIGTNCISVLKMK